MREDDSRPSVRVEARGRALLRPRGSLGVEFKLADAPDFSRSLRTAFADLKLEHLWIVYPGERRYPLAEHVEAVPMADVPEVIARSGL